MVKSVQRGYVEEDKIEGDQFYKDYTITAVNVNKSVVIVNTGCLCYDNHEPSVSNTYDYYYQPCANLIDATTLRIYETYYGSHSSEGHFIKQVTWQVIEYY